MRLKMQVTDKSPRLRPKLFPYYAIDSADMMLCTGSPKVVGISSVVFSVSLLKGTLTVMQTECREP